MCIVCSMCSVCTGYVVCSVSTVCNVCVVCIMCNVCWVYTLSAFVLIQLVVRSFASLTYNVASKMLRATGHARMVTFVHTLLVLVYVPSPSP